MSEELDPDEPAVEIDQDASASLAELRWLIGLSRPYRGRLALVLVAMVLSGAISLVLPAVAGDVVDAAVVDRDLGELQGTILGLLGLFAIAGVLDFFESYTLRATAARLLRELRGRLHRHLLGLSPAFFDKERVGNLLSRLNSDVGSIGGVLTSDIVNGVQQGLVLVGAIVVMALMHTKLTGVMLIAVPPVIVAAVLFGRRFQKLSKERQEKSAEANVAAEESLGGIRTVQSFVQEGREHGRYASRLDDVLRISLRTARVWGAFGATITFFAFSALAMVLWYGGTLVISGDLTAGTLTSFLLYTLTVAISVGTVTSVWGGLKSAAGATERVRELLSTEPEVASGSEPLPPARARGRIVFEGVRFAYASKPDVWAVDGVDLAIEPGETVALVGPSGGGKSTLVSLLPRFHDPSEGVVTLDGTDLRRFELGALRASIGAVPQDIFLFGGTVAENLRFARPDATDAELEEAARAAWAHDFITALPDGYATVVGERGVRLSAGERQRIAIARVLLLDPAIVVLDEATSALDAESEHAVQQAFRRLFDGRTTVVVAHRLATVRRVDRVVVLRDGRIEDSGTHAALFERSEFYRRLCELQMLAVEEPTDA